MGDDGPRLPAVTVRVVYQDLPDLIEIEARVVSVDWSGITCAYTSPSALVEGARGLLVWSERPVTYSRSMPAPTPALDGSNCAAMRSMVPAISRVT
jgi:hypothetical protein